MCALYAKHSREILDMFKERQVVERKGLDLSHESPISNPGCMSWEINFLQPQFPHLYNVQTYLRR